MNPFKKVISVFHGANVSSQFLLELDTVQDRGGRFSLGAQGKFGGVPVYIKLLKLEHPQIATRELEIARTLCKLQTDHRDTWPASLLSTLSFFSGPRPGVFIPMILYPLLEGPRCPLHKDGPPMALHEIQVLMNDMLKALAFLHTTCHLSHGDIHPGNIYESYTCAGKLLYILGDFGLVVRDGEAPGLFVMRSLQSPESFQPDVFSSPQGKDTWQLGVTALRLATGVWPFKPSALGDIERSLGLDTLSDMTLLYIHAVISRGPTYLFSGLKLPILTLEHAEDDQAFVQQYTDDGAVPLDEILFPGKLSLQAVSLLMGDDISVFFVDKLAYYHFCEAISDMLSSYDTRRLPAEILDNPPDFLSIPVPDGVFVSGVAQIGTEKNCLGYVVENHGFTRA